MDKSNNKKILSVLILSAILVFSLMFLTQVLGLSRGGFSQTEIFNQWLFYAAPGGVFLIGVLILFFLEVLIKRDDKKYGDGIAFAPAGEFPSLSYFKRFTSFQLFLLSSIVFSLLASISFITRQQTFTGVGTLPQQFTPVDSILFSSTLVPAAENLSAAFAIALIIFGLRYYARKTTMTPENFRLISWIIVPISIGIIGLLNHMLRYGAQETSLLNVFFFWTLGGVLLMITGAFVVFWSAHIFNNLVYDLSRFISNESILVWFVFGEILMITLYALLYMRGGKKDVSAV